jgi:hypothetical protein
MMKFVSEPIEVTTEGETHKPVRFIWRGEEFTITDLESTWQDWGYAAGAPARTSWRLRRHRNYYRVKTTAGRKFEIYLDRKDKEARRWYIYREISDEDEGVVQQSD